MTQHKMSVWILGDQLLERHQVLVAAGAAVGREGLRLVMVESRQRTGKLPYQRKKLVLLFSAMRHYAAELRRQGYQVDIVQATTFAEGLRQHVLPWQPVQLITMDLAVARYRLSVRTRSG